MNMHGSKQARLSSQRGISLTGLILVLAVIGVIAVVAMKIFPTFLEYRSARAAIIAAKQADGTNKEIIDSFNKNADINDVEALSGKDLIITRDVDTHIAFSYEKKVPLLDNAYLVILYSATTDPTGRIPVKPATPAP
jgi:type II secretory pathway pseudopilin PulG